MIKYIKMPKRGQATVEPSANNQIHLWMQAGHEPTDAEMQKVEDVEVLISTMQDIEKSRRGCAACQS